ADAPVSQTHSHFGSKQRLSLALLEAENDRLLARQRTMFGGPEPLWEQWLQACDFLDEDVESGYVRVLQEMVAAGWSDAEVAGAVRTYLGGWYALLTDVAAPEGHRLGGLRALPPAHAGALSGMRILGVR